MSNEQNKGAVDTENFATLKDQLTEKETELQELKDQLNSLENLENEDQFDDFLNDTHEPYVIVGCSYDPSRILKEVDPVNYRQCFLEFNDNEITEIESKIKELQEEITSLKDDIQGDEK